jgi:hypothetical protein
MLHTNNIFSLTAASAAMHNTMATAHSIRYHTTESRPLLRIITDGLLSNGIDIDRFIFKKNGEYLLCGGLRLTTHAAEQLSPYMKGSGDEPISHMDPRTVTFMKRTNLASPVGYKGPPPRHASLSPSGLKESTVAEAALPKGKAPGLT